MSNKMYILIRSEVDLGHAILAAAHASLGGYLTFVDSEMHKDTGCDWAECPTVDWAMNSFRKVVCRVTEKEFEKAKEYGKNMKDYRIMTECALDNMEVAIVFRPKEEWPNFFKALKLYK